MTMLSIDCLYRVQRACDCSFLFWHRVVIPIYLQDMFETVTDTHRIHVSRGLQNILRPIDIHSNDSLCTLPLFCCLLIDYFSSPALNLAQGVLLWPVFIRHHPSSENHSLIATKLYRNDPWVVPYQSCSNSFNWLHKMLTGSENRLSKCNFHKHFSPIQYMVGAMRDCVRPMMFARHLPQPQDLLDALDREMFSHIKEVHTRNYCNNITFFRGLNVVFFRSQLIFIS